MKKLIFFPMIAAMVALGACSSSAKTEKEAETSAADAVPTVYYIKDYCCPIKIGKGINA